MTYIPGLGWIGGLGPVERRTICGRCAGVGAIANSIVVRNGARRIERQCPRCKGTGKEASHE